MISKLERRIEELERSPAFQPHPDLWVAVWLKAMMSLSLEDQDLVAVVVERDQSIRRPWTEREAAAVKAFEAAFALEVPQAGLNSSMLPTSTNVDWPAFALEAHRAGLNPPMLRASRNVDNWVSRSQRPRIG